MCTGNQRLTRRTRICVNTAYEVEYDQVALFENYGKKNIDHMKFVSHIPRDILKMVNDEPKSN